jgi:ubiquinone/menaquinone biosynthesis C-methylase UbiE
MTYFRESRRMTDPHGCRDERTRVNDLRRRKNAEEAQRYDEEMDLFERWLLGTEHRAWACSQATGSTLEVAIGTGLNLTHYPTTVRLSGIDLSPDMLTIAESRAKRLGLTMPLLVGDAQNLPFEDRSFDTVVCTYALCSVPDETRSILEMKRVLSPGGRLILLDHVRSTVTPIFWLQRLYELIPSRTKGEYMTRRPAVHVVGAGFEIQARDRLRAGIVERLVAMKPLDDA